MISKPDRQSRIINSSPETYGTLGFDWFEGEITHPDIEGLKNPTINPMDGYGEKLLFLKIGVNPRTGTDHEGVEFSGSFMTTGKLVRRKSEEKGRDDFEALYFTYQGQMTWVNRNLDTHYLGGKMSGKSREFNDTLVLLGWDYIYGETEKATTEQRKSSQYNKFREGYQRFAEAIESYLQSITDKIKSELQNTLSNE